MVDELDEIERGFSLLIERLQKVHEIAKNKIEDLKKRDGELIQRMAMRTTPLIPHIGVSLLKRGKQDTKGEIYDAEYYPKKMIVLAKTDPAPFRPDDPSKKVIDQFSILSEDGSFYLLMYSFDGFFTDSYLDPISPQDLINLYGYEPMFMLYQALKSYLQNEEELIKALDFIMTIFLGEKAKNQ